MRLLGLTTISLLLAAPVASISQSPGAASPKSTQTCGVQLDPPTAGEAALARKDFDTALAFYRD